jgi:opacity protein-like surface antigen
MEFLLSSPSQAQVGGVGGVGGMGAAGGGSGEIAAIPGGGNFGSATDPSAVQITEGFHVVPMITVGQRYDSNVFFAPKELLTPGLDKDDFVTTVTPQIRGIFAGDLVSVNSRVGAAGQYFAKNTELSNVGANAGMIVDASKLVSQFWPGTRFTVADSYVFTPEPPAFLTGNLDLEELNPLIRGFQASRVSSQINSVSVGVGVPLSLTVDLMGRYTNSLTHFGESKVQQAGILLDTMFQTYMVGLTRRISLQDTVSGYFEGSSANADSARSFMAYGGGVGWDHTFNEKVSLRATAGMQYVNDNSGSGTSSTAPKGSLLVWWKDNRTSWRLSYNVGLTPSLQFAARPILTQAVNFVVIRQTSIQDLMTFVGLNYGRGNELGGAPSLSEISFTSYGATGGMSYKVTSKSFVVLTYNYSRFDNGFGLQRFEFDRNLVQVVLTQALY